MAFKKKWGILVLCLCSIGLFASLVKAEEGILLRCESSAKAPEVYAYEITVRDHKYNLQKKIGANDVAQMPLDRVDSVVGYDGTYLFFQNLGRSGYLLIYFHKASSPERPDRALIDINLFQPLMQPMNSQGPRSDFVCKLAAN